jgi:hypothetical protein
MAKDKKERDTAAREGARAGLVRSVQTPLGFFVLVVLVVEAILGVVVAATTDFDRSVTIGGMLVIIAGLVATVAFLAYYRPEALRGDRPGSSSPSDDQSAHDFCNRISGHWWERIRPDEPSAISFVEIRPDPATNTVKMKGRAYSTAGELAAIWESVASCINLSERRLFYYWKGWHPLRPNEPYEGFGEVSFHGSSNRIDSAVGFFSDTNLTDMKSTTKKSVEFRRSTETEIQVMREGNEKSIAEMVRTRLG